MNKLFVLADKIEAKLKKIANMPDSTTVKPVIDRVYQSMKSNPALRGTIGIAPEVSVSGNIGDPVLVYFQVMTDNKSYQYLVEDPARTNLVNILKPAVEQALQTQFRQYDFRVKFGVVPS